MIMTSQYDDNDVTMFSPPAGIFFWKSSLMSSNSFRVLDRGGLMTSHKYDDKFDDVTMSMKWAKT